MIESSISISFLNMTIHLGSIISDKGHVCGQCFLTIEFDLYQAGFSFKKKIQRKVSWKRNIKNFHKNLNICILFKKFHQYEKKLFDIKKLFHITEFHRKRTNLKFIELAKTTNIFLFITITFIIA